MPFGEDSHGCNIYTHRIDPDLMAKSEAIYAALGIPLGTAVNVFLMKSAAVVGFPFGVRLDLPSRDTVEAMLEAETIVNDTSIEAFSVDDALEALKK